jgi:very-short-patch-repair endonuclease
MKRRMFSGAEAFIFNRARELRGRQTFAEEILWTYLRSRPLGFKFRRQHPYSNYILDFYCHGLKLVIELDGSIHDPEEVKQNDEIRQRQLEQDGFTFLRFSNQEIKSNSEQVFQKIETFLRDKDEKTEASTS